MSTFRNLLVIDDFTYDDQDWRLNIYPLIKTNLDEWHKNSGDYRRTRKVDRMIANLGSTANKQTQLWEDLISAENGPCLWTYAEKTPALWEFLGQRIKKCEAKLAQKKANEESKKAKKAKESAKPADESKEGTPANDQDK